MLYNVIWERGVVKNMTFSRYIIYGWPQSWSIHAFQCTLYSPCNSTMINVTPRLVDKCGNIVIRSEGSTWSYRIDWFYRTFWTCWPHRSDWTTWTSWSYWCCNRTCSRWSQRIPWSARKDWIDWSTRSVCFPCTPADATDFVIRLTYM